MAEPKEKSHNEIDLVDLFSSIWKGIVSIFRILLNAILYLFVFGIKNSLWLIIILIIGLGFGYLIYSKTPRFFSSEMIAQPNGFTSIDMAQYINDIHDMCQGGNIAAIASALQLDESTAEQIKDIEAFFFIDVNLDGIGDEVDYNRKYDPRDTTRAIVKNRLLIRAEVLDNGAFTKVKDGLRNYIDNNPYLLKVNDLRKRELQALISQAELEIEKLDSLQNFEYYQSIGRDPLNRDGQIVFMNEKLTQLYYQDKQSLLNRRLDYQAALELATEPITIIKDFTSLQREENPMLGYLLKFGFVFVVIGYFGLMIFKNRHTIVPFLADKA